MFVLLTKQAALIKFITIVLGFYEIETVWGLGKVSFIFVSLSSYSFTLRETFLYKVLISCLMLGTILADNGATLKQSL
jgi:hypothetical protein